MGNRVLTCVLILVIVAAFAVPVFASEAEHAGGNMNPVDFSEMKADLALWTAVVFVCLVVVLGKFAWRPIVEGLDKREQNVADQITQAETAHQKAKDLLAQYEKKLADAQDQVHVLLEQGRRSAEQAGHALIEKAKEESKAEQQRALQQIDAATTAALNELGDRSATLAVDLAGKIIHAKLQASDHAQLIEQAVAGFVHSKGLDRVSRN